LDGSRIVRRPARADDHRMLRAALRDLLAGRGRKATGDWKIARYAAVCRACRAPIAPGEAVLHSPGRTVCRACGV
jgi:hypothetical protein